MVVYIRNCNFIYCISNINYCYDTYLSKTRKKVMIIVNIGLQIPINSFSADICDVPSIPVLT